MKPSEIKVDVTYRNKGAGRTTRRVLQISNQLKAPWFSSVDRPDCPVVQFINDKSVIETLYLSSFASWAGSIVKEEE